MSGFLIFIYVHRLDECVKASPAGSASKSVRLANARISAVNYIDSFIKTCTDPQIFATAPSLYSPSMLAQVLERVRIPEAGILRCSGEEIGRFVRMLRNPYPALKKIAAFALLQVFFFSFSLK